MEALVIYSQIARNIKSITKHNKASTHLLKVLAHTVADIAHDVGQHQPHQLTDALIIRTRRAQLSDLDEVSLDVRGMGNKLAYL